MGKVFQKKDYWTTKVSTAEPEKTWIRGYDQEDILKKCSYTEGLFITLKGRIPSKNEVRMLDALLCALLDHGFLSAPIPVARCIVSTNPQMIPAIAGGLLSCGTYAVSPQEAGEFIEWAYKLMKDKGLTKEEAAREIVEQVRSQKKRIPGIGHPFHKQIDPRAQSLLRIAEECGFAGEKVRLFQTIHHEFLRISGKVLPINVDGMMACIMSEMALSPLEMIGINVISHMPGIVAHIVEEMQEGFIGRGLPSALTEYCGKTGLSIEK
jgi:citrate synthase